MIPVVFEPTIPASERPYTDASDRAGHWDRQFLMYGTKISRFALTGSQLIALAQNTKLNPFFRASFFPHVSAFKALTDLDEIWYGPVDTKYSQNVFLVKLLIKL